MPDKQMTAKELGAALWACADELRSHMDANDYKDYLLGLIFYKALSDAQLYVIADFLEMPFPVTLQEAQQKYESTKGTELFQPLQNQLAKRYGVAVEPDFTFTSFCQRISQNTFQLDDLRKAFNKIEQADTRLYSGLFEGFNIYSNKLGNTLNERNELIGSCMWKLNQYDFASYGTDIMGDAYEYLIGQFAENSGKKAGEFYTPQQVSRILAAIVTHGKEHTDNYTVYDPCCGSASLLLQPKNFLDSKTAATIQYFGQDINQGTVRLARMNFMLHQIPAAFQHLHCADTLGPDWPTDTPTMFQAVLMNPAYSARWSPEKVSSTDQRFIPYEKLAPKSRADYAFLLHGLYHLNNNGMMGIVLPHGVLSRSGAEGVIRKKLIEQGRIWAVVGLAPKLFYNTSIPVCLIFLRKDMTDRSILFVDASQEFEKGTPQNHLSDENVSRIVHTVLARKDVDKFAHLASYEEIEKNGFNLNIPLYVDISEPEPEVDIDAVIAEYGKVSGEEAELKKSLEADFQELGISFPGV